MQGLMHARQVLYHELHLLPLKNVFDIGSCYIAQAGLELQILLPQPSQC
jgi:hypothetical protein